jgi:hypothetical protein
MFTLLLGEEFIFTLSFEQDCLYAKCTPYVTDCVMGELEKLGSKYRVALRIVKDPRFERLPCTHSGTYADDCLVQRVTQHKCYIVATCDKVRTVMLISILRPKLNTSCSSLHLNCCSYSQ